MKKLINNSTLEIKQADITEQSTDAIVNPANEQLILGAGVAGAIRMKGGPEIQRECDKIGSVKAGQAVITSAGRLGAKYVIHVVGPREDRPGREELLAVATVNALKLAQEYKLESISFPAISTGVFGFPMVSCAKIMLSTVQNYLKGQSCIKHVVFCLFDNFSYNVFMDELLREDDKA